MLAIPGVSDDQDTGGGSVVPAGLRRVAKISSWKPTGSAGSLGVRPLKLMELAGGGGGVPPELQVPSVLPVGPCHAPRLSRCSVCPSVLDDWKRPMSVELIPAAGPLVAVKTPS